MTTKTSGKAPQLRQMAFDYERPAYRAKSSDKRLNELLAIRGVYRGSDSRFVATANSVNTTHQRNQK